MNTPGYSLVSNILLKEARPFHALGKMLSSNPKSREIIRRAKVIRGIRNKRDLMKAGLATAGALAIAGGVAAYDLKRKQREKDKNK
jgi:hypothetical protein